MVLKGCLLVTAGFMMAFGVWLYTPLPGPVEDPIVVQFNMCLWKLIWTTGELLQYLGFGNRFLLGQKLTPRRHGGIGETVMEGTVKVTRDMIEDVPVIIYQPLEAESLAPAMVFFHGGGWVLGSADATHQKAHLYANKTKLVVINVDYRLAPQHPFPAGIEDCLAVTRFILRHGQRYGIDVNRVGVGGDSAGGNFAAIVALQLAQEKNDLPPLIFQVLHVPALQAVDLRLPSSLNSYIPSLDAKSMYGFYAMYLGLGVEGKDVDHYAKILSENRHISPEFKESEYAKFVDRNLLPKEYQTPKRTASPVTEPYDPDVFMKIKDMLVNPLFSPIMSKNLAGPPAFIHAAEFDVLRDDALLYARRLKEAGVKVDLHMGKGGFHTDSLVMLPKFLQAQSGQKALSEAFRFIAKILRK